MECISLQVCNACLYKYAIRLSTSVQHVMKDVSHHKCVTHQCEYAIHHTRCIPMQLQGAFSRNGVAPTCAYTVCAM